LQEEEEETDAKPPPTDTKALEMVGLKILPKTVNFSKPIIGKVDDFPATTGIEYVED